MQIISSANTSINVKLLPQSTKKINWQVFKNSNILDIGGGKYNNLKCYLKDNYNITLFIYDKYNRSAFENHYALNCNPEFIICNNVLNVIDNNETLQNIANLIKSYNVNYLITVYEGNKSGIGKITKKDCYQRNSIIKDYLFLFENSFIFKNCIVNNKNVLI